jgi:hypothetical protein
LRVDGARLRFHDLRHTFASHLIIDLGLDVVQVSRLMGHASPSTTLNIYAHMFDEARHAADILARMARSAFAGLLEKDEDERIVITLPAAAGSPGAPLSARQRAAISGQLDQNLTNQDAKHGQWSRSNQSRCSDFVWERAGLEPATSWVRGAHVGAG